MYGVLTHYFDRTPPATLTAATILDINDDVMVEPHVDAVVILGQFIGDTQYSSDIYQCPCHPKII